MRPDSRLKEITHLANRAIKIYKRDGIRVLYRSMRDFSRRRLFDTLSRSGESGFNYQIAKREGVEERWNIIDPYLSENKSVLDIGCNAGLFLKKASNSNMFAIGVEKNSETVEDGIKYHGKARDFGIVNREININTVKSLPSFDYIFVLSIHHHLYRQYGEKEAEKILKILVEKTEDTLFFEPASRKDLYGDQGLPFDDFDDETIIDYNIEMLENIKPAHWKVEYIGSRSQGTPGNRHIFALSRNQS